MDFVALEKLTFFIYFVRNALLLLGSIIYRSARGTKHFGYHQLDKDSSEPAMQRSVTSVHPKRHERRPAMDVFRMPGRSGVSSGKVAPAATTGNKSEDLLIDIDADCSAAAPQTMTSSAGKNINF